MARAYRAPDSMAPLLLIPPFRGKMPPLGACQPHLLGSPRRKVQIPRPQRSAVTDGPQPRPSTQGGAPRRGMPQTT
ncbi:hypothetical protein GQ53DRAFT_751991 [Thozetella sp. PMI_491]|nr:hypothetical protein GQ53DRAFT_751991 [Thozetella sp. PMI_491]